MPTTRGFESFRALPLVTLIVGAACAPARDSAPGTTSAAGHRRGDSAVTTVLDAPPEGVAFEPTLAIDPANPDRMVVSAMRGMPPAGSSSAIWMWRTADGGAHWDGGALPSPRVAGDTAAPSFAADVVAAFATDGSPILTSMSGIGARFGVFLSRLPSDTGARATRIFENRRDAASGHLVFYDKTSLAVDRRDDSPYRGSVYVAIGAIEMAAPPPRLGAPWPGPLITRVELAASRDGGRTFAAPVVVSDSAFAGQVTVAPRGVLDVTYSRLVDKSGNGNAVLHRRSLDGGTTFGAATLVYGASGDTLLDIPVLASRPDGSLMACWGEGARPREGVDLFGNHVRCALRPGADGAAWSPPFSLDPTLPPDADQGWGAVVGTDAGWYAMQYVVRDDRTDVVLYRSTGTTAFERVATLASIDGLGRARFCTNSVMPCRRTRTDAFALGDYVTLAAAGNRIAAAYILPRHAGAKPDSASLWFSTLTAPH